MMWRAKQDVTGCQFANSVFGYAIAIADFCQWQWQFTGSGFQPVEKQQKQVAYTHKSAKWSFSAQKQRLTLFYSLLRGVWVLFEVQRAERASWGANPKGMTLRGPANGMADRAPISFSDEFSGVRRPAHGAVAALLASQRPAVLAVCALCLLSAPLSAQSDWGSSGTFDLKQGTQQRKDAAQARLSASGVWTSSAEPNVWSSLDAFERGTPGKARPAVARFTLPRGPKLEQLFAVIAFAEAPRRGYDALHGSATRLPAKPPTHLTLGEIKTWIKDTPGQHHAIGNFQIIPSTLLNLQKRLGLPDSVRFTRATQNKMAALLVSDAGYRAAIGDTLPLSDFMDNLAQIWAGLPLASGMSAYHGYAGNRATVTRAFFEKQVMGIFG